MIYALVAILGPTLTYVLTLDCSHFYYCPVTYHRDNSTCVHSINVYFMFLRIILYTCVCNNIKFLTCGYRGSGYLFLYHFQEGNTDIAPVRPVVGLRCNVYLCNVISRLLNFGLNMLN